MRQSLSTGAYLLGPIYQGLSFRAYLPEPIRRSPSQPATQQISQSTSYPASQPAGWPAAEPLCQSPSPAAMQQVGSWLVGSGC